MPYYSLKEKEDLCFSLEDWLIDLVGRVFANGLGDWGSTSGRVIQKTL